MHNLVFMAHLLVTASVILLLLRYFPESGRLPAWVLGVASAITLVLEWAFFKVSFPAAPFWDFIECYFPAGKAALYFDLSALHELYVRVVQGFVNMPIVAYLFAPFALFGANAAAILYTVIGVAASVAAWWLLARVAQLQRRERWILALLFLANGALINGLKFGNTSHFILLAMVGGLTLLKAGRPASAGAVLGVAAILKPALGLFGVFFLLRRDLRGFCGFAAACLLISLVSLAVFGWAFNVFWFETSILQFGRQWFSTFSVQSIPGFLLRLRFETDMLVSWRPVIPTSTEQLAARVLLGSLYVYAAWVCLGRVLQAKQAETDAASRRDLQFLLVVCLAIVASPLSWSHYYVWLLIPAAFFLKWLATSALSGGQQTMGWLAIALATPLIVWPWAFHQPLLSALYATVVVSHLLIAGLLWFGLVSWWLIREPGDSRALRA